MKIRNGFVSNSSSSSFVVAFSEIPQNVDDMQRILFGEEKSFDSGLDYYEKSIYTSREIATTVFSDFIEQAPANRKKIISEFSHGYLDGGPDMPHSNDKKEWATYEKAIQKFSCNIGDRFIKENKGKFFFVFSYSDDSSYSGTLEHGDIFRNLSHYRISHH